MFHINFDVLTSATKKKWARSYLQFFFNEWKNFKDFFIIDYIYHRCINNSNNSFHKCIQKPYSNECMKKQKIF